MAFPTHIASAAGITEDGMGNILLVKTHRHGWIFPGGQVENGESLTDAVIRETKEESGIDVLPGKLVAIYSNLSSYTWHDGVTHVPTKVNFDFICSLVGGELAVSDETSDSMWVPKDQVLEYITHPVGVYKYKNYLAYDGRIKYISYIAVPEFEIKSETYV